MAPDPDVERRRYRRVPVTFRSTVRLGHGQESTGILVDLSLGGCRIRSDAAVTVSNVFELEIYPEAGPDFIWVEQAVVRWAREGEFGVAFVKVASAQQIRIRTLIQSLTEDRL